PLSEPAREVEEGEFLELQIWHQCKSSQCKGDNLKFPLSQSDAESPLREDLQVMRKLCLNLKLVLMANTTLQPLQQCVAKYIKVDVKVNDYQCGTLVSAAYYLGRSTYKNVSNICQAELLNWYSASGKGSEQKRYASQITLSMKGGGKSYLPCKYDSKRSNSSNRGGKGQGQGHKTTPNKAYEKNTIGWSGNDKTSGSGKNDPKSDGMNDGKHDGETGGDNDGETGGQKNGLGNDNDQKYNSKNGSKTGGEKSGWGGDDDSRNNNGQREANGKMDKQKEVGQKNDRNTGKGGKGDGW
ncbi:hypothetical protein AC579_5913, partial [Pseudocercospora musae]